MNITATVAMPLYNMGKIAELALEGLCNQVTDYKWELIVCEEQNENMLGKDLLHYKYNDRLKQAGCEFIFYFSAKEWIPLGQKWKLMAEMASDTNCFILQAGDCYPHPKRIDITAFHFKQNDKLAYYDEARGYFYSFKYKKTMLFNPDYTYRHPCRLNMAWKTEFMKKLPDNAVKKAVDKYLWVALDKGMVVRNEILYIDGVDTDGYNQISKRDKYFTNKNNIFKPTEVDITKHLPILKKFEL